MAKHTEPKQITTMRLSPTVIRRLDRIAELRECTRSALINVFIADGLRLEERRRLAPAVPAPEPVVVGALD